MNGWPLPGSLIEAGNWMMAILFAAMLASAGVYFVTELRRYRWGFWKSYAESKASWAATILFAGMFVRTLDIAVVRHFQNHGHPIPWDADLAAMILIFSTVPIVWGSICWMRAVLPLYCWSWAWFALAVVAVGGGVVLSRYDVFM